MYVYNSYDRHNSTCLSFCHIITCMCKQCKPGSLSLPDYTKVQLQVWSAFSACNRSSWCKHNVVCLSPTGGVESLITVATVGIAVASTAVVTFIAGVLAGVLLYHCVSKHQSQSSKLESFSHPQKTGSIIFQSTATNRSRVWGGG